jgi:hypothetical protein
MRGAYKALFVLRDGRTGVKILAGAGCLWQCQSHKPQTALTRPDAIIVVGLRIMLEKGGLSSRSIADYEPMRAATAQGNPQASRHGPGFAIR